MNSAVTKKSYPKILEGGFNSLSCFYEQLTNSPSDGDFFRIISENVVPLIQQSSQIKPLYLKWIDENEIYEKNWQHAKAEASKTLEETYHSIHIGLRQKKLLDEPEISHRIALIESLLQFNSSYKNFRYFQNFSNQLKLLFHQILKLDEMSLIQSFAEIEEMGEIPFQNTVGHTDNLLILSFVFDPLLKQLSNLEKVTNWNSLTKPWVAFNKLIRAERAWNNQAQDLEKKGLMEEYLEWRDMKDLRNSTISEELLFFKRENHQNYIEILLNEILVHHETLPSKDPQALRECTIPQSIYLDCKHNQLTISLFNDDNQYLDTIILHKFKEVSSPRDFFEDLISKGVGNTVDCEKGGGSVPKHILDVRFPSIFTDLFIHKISKYKAALKTNPIVLEEVSRDDANKIIQAIDKLKDRNIKTPKNN